MWFREISNDSDVVISTRVRFARSVDGFKFPHMLSAEENNAIVDLVSKSVNKKKYSVLKMNNIDEITKKSLVEQHLISKEFEINQNGALLANTDNTIVTMINEEDHLRIQSFCSGFNIDKCYNQLVDFTDELNNKINFTESEKYGYITACPTNVGSAMRVSVMLHLPGLVKLGLLNKLLSQATSIGFAIRGYYGENSAGGGNMYQISNQKTLGISDQDIIYNIKTIVSSIIEQERKARELLLNTNKYLEDSVYRSYGILKNARIIGDEESLKLLSEVRLGVSSKILNDVDLLSIQKLMVDTKENTLKTILKENFSNEEEDIKRAEYIRRELN